MPCRAFQGQSERRHFDIRLFPCPSCPNDVSWSFICVPCTCALQRPSIRQLSSADNIWFLCPIRKQQCRRDCLYAWKMPSTRLDDAYAHTCVPPKVAQLQEITGSSLALSVKRESAADPSAVTYGTGPRVKCPQRRRTRPTLYRFHITYTSQHVHNNTSANWSLSH